MAILYNGFICMRTALYMVILCLGILVLSQGTARADSTLFEVDGVKVDITEENAALARKNAFEQAQREAFETLTQRMVAEGDDFFIEPPELMVISSLIQDYEITQEKISNVRYIGTYKFRFKDKEVRKYFAEQGLGYTDVSSKPVLVLPFYAHGAKPVLWPSDNPWMEAWRAAGDLQGLVPVIVPIGDLEDVRDLGIDQDFSFDREGLQRVLKRYGAGEAVLILALPDQDLALAEPEAVLATHKLEIRFYRTDLNEPQLAQNTALESKAGETIYQLYGRAVQKVRGALQRNWKKKTLVNATQGNHLKANIRFGSLKEWAQTQKALEKVYGLNELQILSITSNKAQVKLLFEGSEKRLRLALDQADMTLSKPRINIRELTAGTAAGAPLVYDLYMNRYQ